MLDEKRLWTEGFVFDRIHLGWEEVEMWLDENLYDELPVTREGYDVPLRWDDIGENCMRGIVQQLYGKLPDSLAHLLFDLKWDAHMMRKGDYMHVHTDAGEGGPFQILVWVCPHNVFKGREFVYGERDHLMERKPENGLVCIMNTADPKFIHGVKPLLSEDDIVTITGYFK